MADLELPAEVLSAAARRQAKRLVYLWRNRTPDLGLYLEEARRLWAITHAADHAWSRYLSEEWAALRRNVAEHRPWRPAFPRTPNVDHGLLVDDAPPVYIEGLWIRALSLPRVVLEKLCTGASDRDSNVLFDLWMSLDNTSDESPDLRRFARHIGGAVAVWSGDLLRVGPQRRADLRLAWMAGHFDFCFDTRVQERCGGQPTSDQDTKAVASRRELAKLLDRRAEIFDFGLILSKLSIADDDDPLNRPSEPTE